MGKSIHHAWIRVRQLVAVWVVVLTSVFALSALVASPASAYYRFWAAGNVWGSWAGHGYVAPLTGDEAFNYSCIGNGAGCWQYMCSWAWTTWGTTWGPVYCGYDDVYHSFANMWLYPVAAFYNGTGQYDAAAEYW